MKKKIIFVSIAVLFLVFVGLFVFSLTQMQTKTESSAEDTKYFGLMNSNTEEQPDTTKETTQKEYADRPAITKNMATQIPTTVQRYLSVGDFDTLDSYLMDIQNTYQDGEGVDIKMEDIQSIRADLAMIDSMTSYNAPTMMKSFRNPDVLAAAMVFCPLSCKYTSMYNVDSLMVPAEEGTQVNLTETEMDPDEFTEIIGYVNRSEDNYFTDVKQYSGQLYGANFDFIVAYSLTNNAWMPYIIRSTDERANKVFKRAQDLQRMVDNGVISEETMDSAMTYSDLNEIDMSVYEDPNIQTFEFAD